MFRQSIRLFSSTRIANKSITDTAKDALIKVNEVASKAALKGVEGTEAVADAAKATVAGSSSKAAGTMDQVKGETKKMAGQAEQKAEQVKQKI